MALDEGYGFGAPGLSPGAMPRGGIGTPMLKQRFVGGGGGRQQDSPLMMALLKMLGGGGRQRKPRRSGGQPPYSTQPLPGTPGFVPPGLERMSGGFMPPPPSPGYQRMPGPGGEPDYRLSGGPVGGLARPLGSIPPPLDPTGTSTVQIDPLIEQLLSEMMLPYAARRPR